MLVKSVVITGASSGIGEALAVRYGRGGSELALVGRDRDRLERVAAKCRASGAAVRMGIIDVRDRASIRDWLTDIDRATPIDLLIANAGVYAGTPPGQQVEDADAAYLLMETNILGVLNAVHPVLPLMLARGRGQIAMTSSVAGIASLRDGPAYSASKSAILSYGLGLRERLHGTGVRVNVLCPGYVTSPMSLQIQGWKPLEVSAERAAERIVRGLERDHAVIAFPGPLVLAARFARVLPAGIRRLAMWPFRSYALPRHAVEAGPKPNDDDLADTAADRKRDT